MSDGNNILELSLAELVRLLEAKKVSAAEVTRACLERIHSTSHLNNFITVCEADALAEAERADSMRRGGASLPLLGVPVAVKDNFCTSGVRTTCGSNYFKDYIPTTDSAAVCKLRAAGAVIIGKTNMDELAMGSTNRSSAFGCVKNALDITRIPGGSSGGSANAVCAKQVFGSLGSDTGGSVRQPAAHCGVVGLKPTFGAIDASGMLAVAPSLDTAGVFGRDVLDAALMFNGCARKGGIDLSEITGNVRGTKVGVAREFLDEDTIDDGVRAAFDTAVGELERAGATIKILNIPSFRAAIAVYHIISSAEAAKNIKALCALTENDAKSGEKNLQKFGAEVKRRIITGAFVSREDNYSDILGKAVKMREAIKADYAAALGECDFLFCPTTSHTAIRLSDKVDPHKAHLSDMFASPASLAGLPAVSVPFGTSEAMPVGVQIIGKSGCEAGILNVGKALN